MVPVTLPSLLELSLRGVQELVCQFSIKAVSHMAQENRRWREKANEGIIGCSEEEEDEIKVLIFLHTIAEIYVDDNSSLNETFTIKY